MKCTTIALLVMVLIQCAMVHDLVGGLLRKKTGSSKNCWDYPKSPYGNYGT